MTTFRNTAKQTNLGCRVSCDNLHMVIFFCSSCLKIEKMLPISLIFILLIKENNAHFSKQHLTLGLFSNIWEMVELKWCSYFMWYIIPPGKAETNKRLQCTLTQNVLKWKIQSLWLGNKEKINSHRWRKTQFMICWLLTNQYTHGHTHSSGKCGPGVVAVWEVLLSGFFPPMRHQSDQGNCCGKGGIWEVQTISPGEQWVMPQLLWHGWSHWFALQLLTWRC